MILKNIYFLSTNRTDFAYIFSTIVPTWWLVKGVFLLTHSSNNDFCIANSVFKVNFLNSFCIIGTGLQRNRSLYYYEYFVVLLLIQQGMLQI